MLANVSRDKPLKLADANGRGGETITSNEALIRLEVFEGRIAPEDAMRELDTMGCRQLAAERRRHEAEIQQLSKETA